MIIVDEKGHILKALEELDLLETEGFEDVKVMSVSDFLNLPLQSNQALVVVDIPSVLQYPESVESFRGHMNTFSGVVFTYPEKEAQMRQWAQTEAGIFPHVLQVQSWPMPELEVELFKNLAKTFARLRLEQQQYQKQITQFSQDLDQLLRLAQQEISRAKNVHNRLVPKRIDEYKGVSVVHRYAAGSGIGTEFSDVIQDGSNLYQIIFATSSFLLSSTAVSLIQEMKAKKFNPMVFLQTLKDEVITLNQTKKKKIESHLMIMSFDLTQLKASFMGWGEFEYFGQVKGSGKIDFVGESMSFHKDERIIFFSPGFVSNWNEYKSLPNKQQIVENHSKGPIYDLLTELIFQLKKASAEDFLNRDATVVALEVNRHGIQQV